jgi:hypothetical protein
VIYLPVKLLLNSANCSGFNTYKIHKNNPLYFQHLRNFSHLFILKALKLPVDSTLTRPLSLTPAESTLTKNRGRGVGLVPLTKNARTLASLFHSLCQERNLSPTFPITCALFAQNSRGVPQLFPIWNCIRAISRANHSMVNSDARQLTTEN